MYNLVKYKEHFCGEIPLDSLQISGEHEFYFPKRRENSRYKCVGIYPGETSCRVELSYFIGVDWISKNQPIYIEPKLNSGSNQTNYLKMLFESLRFQEASESLSELFLIKFDEEHIEIDQKDDLLTPLLIVQFLQLVKAIVRKGVKKSYYKVEQNIHSRVKGKIQVSKTIKLNHSKSKLLDTYCSFEQFGVNGIENRLIKKALLFTQKFLPTLRSFNSDKYTIEAFNYIMPAFEHVTDEVNLNEIKFSKANAFYREYESAIKLAKLILKRFGYNISNTQKDGKIKTPPFWIDMSLLFELYVLGLLKEKYGNAISYQEKANYGYLDFMLNDPDSKIVIDAKYKPQYSNEYIIDDIRQISGYCRDKRILNKMGYLPPDYNKTVLKGLIIYPDGEYLDKDQKETIMIEKVEPIEEFVELYKMKVRLPAL
ncbi:MAG: hypothetical protein JNK50_06055 [Bacteroidia bacterium]|nr:hypothetical protein [Bacteroidia bacterium]